MHKELGKEGLVCISLSVDDEESAPAALKFLKKMEATFTNYRLEDSDANKKKLDKVLTYTAPPIVHVFDRTGKKVKTFEGAVTDEELEGLVKELLKKK